MQFGKDITKELNLDLNNLEAATFEIVDDVAVITMNRPEAANSLNTAMHRDVVACFDEVHNNDNIKAAVITASGRFFCAGRDIKEFVGTYAEKNSDALRPIDDPNHVMFATQCNHYDVWKPLIGAVNGAAVGGGLEIAIMCDMIVMSDDTYIADLHAKINVGGMNSMNTFLPAMIARELTMTDRRLTAQECLSYGFANYVLPKDQILEKAIDLAKATALMGPDSIQRLKQGSIDLQRKSGNLRYENYYETRKANQMKMIEKVKSDDDLLEGMEAFVEKRKSDYKKAVKTDEDFKPY
ncbi:MAG: enoyl-CoA hydratase/isomerase family protein [Dehalococcoidia bacterium]|jgi:enoyl-CoA hydratase/carnithine racemase|nr:enoyl-CoA hydratase/isomerase family protein [Dehalococcoidia bacterium]